MYRTLLLIILLIPASYLSAEEGDMTFRRYDVSTITAIRLARHIKPLGLQENWDWDEYWGETFDEEPFAFLEGDVLVEIIRSTVEMESWDMEGASIEYRAPDHLYVRNRGHVQKKVETLLAGLDAAASRRVLMRVKVYQLPEGSYALEGGKAPALDMTKARLLESGSIESWPGVAAAFKVTNRVRVLHDYDVEIAQESAIAQPVLAPALEGLAVELTPHITLDGKRVRIDALILQGSFVRPFPKLMLSDRDSGYLGEVDLPLFRQYETSGQAFAGEAGLVTFPLVAAGRPLVVTVKSEILGEPGPPALVDASILALPLAEYETGFLLESDSEWMEFGSPRLIPNLDNEGPYGSIEELIELIVTQEDPWYWEEEGSIAAIGDNRFYMEASAEVRARVMRFLTARESEFLHPIGIFFHVYSVPKIADSGVVDGFDAGKARLLHGCGIHTFSGRAAFANLGSTQNYIAGYDVEVAEKAAISDPVIGQSFEGLALNVRPHLSGDRKRVSLDLRFLISDRAMGDKPRVGGAKHVGVLTHLEEKRSVFNTTIQMPAGRLYVMDAGPDPDDPERRLAVVINVKVN